ncbi:MAG: sugar ABC transporter substrate-binding protein [Flexilinea sp.]|jgi:ribose transport system substrate-binding protein
MKKMSRMMVLTSLLLVAVSLVGVFASAAAEDAKVKIGVSVADQSNVFYIDILDGMKSALKDGDELVVMDAAFDPAKQISDIEDMIQQEVDVMLIDPVDSKGIQASLEACKEAGIPIITYNSPVDDKESVVSNVASDNFMAGQLIGEALAKALDGKGDVVMLTYNVAMVCLDRANGFIDAISKYPDIKIVESQEIQPGVDTALPVMENMLQAFPELDGVFALNDPSAIGCAAAVESAGLLDKIKIVGVDGSDEGKVAISEGKMLASAAQHPVEIGSLSIETAYKVIAGEEVEADVKVPVELVNIDNWDK